MSTGTTVSQLVHAVMGVDWHGWLFLLGVLGPCWVLAILIAAVLFAGSACAPRRNPARTVAVKAAVAANVRPSQVQGGRRV